MKMDRARVKFNITSFSIFFFLLSCFAVHSLADEPKNTKENPFTPKASLIRYWNNHISNKLPHSTFLLSKASPLSPQESSFFAKLASDKSLSSHLPAFCSSADLFCLVGSKPVLENHKTDANFAVYTTNKQFSNYGNARLGGADQFKNYSDGVNFAASSFARYSRGSTAHHEGFASYASEGNVASSNFSSYAASATGGSGDFKGYVARVNVPELRFSSYDSDGNGHKLAFASYADDTNSGNQAFVGYARNGNSVPVGFTSYADTSNVVGSGFTGYGLSGNAANDSFKGYATNANNPNNNFRNYGGGGNGGLDTFNSYRDSANAGTDTFQSYGRSSSSEKTDFVNYGKSFNVGFDTFKEYAKGAVGHMVGFKIYGLNTTFKEYAQKKGITFAQYARPSDDSAKTGVKNPNNRVEQGKFFRESMLKEGTVMKMPNIRDWMPKRSFLPRTIMSRLPFSTNELNELKRTFQAEDNSTMEHVLVNALNECERAPSPGETKQCVGSAEDMIDFAVSVLGRDVVVRTTEGVKGSGQDVVIGKVNGVNGGRVTKSVSCHQSLYPYLLYYCHSVPKVRVYEADILDVEGKARINHGVAICHLDTSAWSPGHGAFLALGSSPGLIEVCHWIFENDMTWTSAD
ncbi:probable polygalacturonase non-catalytic subunit jp650 [Phtheirospermum japonicum]|uniref:Probable polygalacturonase non-catalytic subunit jp650 n=1 Tax=Phtheirospermum japonicum TaxID=374723 RepID=A0A830CM16_9LAMI|nr:probable polygalacturonase non-catalytic subunit jp650 [Phtheirospermum japonicum]